MRRRRQKYDIYIFIFSAVLLVGYLAYNKFSSEDRGITAYQSALESYKASDFEKAYYKTRTLDKVSPADNALREKAFEIHSKNPIPSFLGKIKGGFQGFMYGMSNYLPVIACSALAILGKNIVAKAGVVGLGCIAVYKVLRNGLGVGKNNPMT